MPNLRSIVSIISIIVVFDGVHRCDGADETGDEIL
jgi:hypothetical protein